MTLETSAVISSLAMAVILAAVFLVLYTVERRGYLGIFSLGWLVYALRFLFELLHAARPADVTLILLSESAIVGNASLTLFGVYSVMSLKQRTPWLLTAALTAVFIGLIVAFGVDEHTVTDALLVISGAVYIWVGAVLIRRLSVSVIGRRLAGTALILWGIHKLDFPVVDPITAAVPWAYFASTLLSFLVAIGVLIVFYEVMHADVEEREERYRGVFNNHHTPMLLTDPESGAVIDANEAATMFYGYPEETLRQMTLFELTLDPEGVVRERMSLHTNGLPRPFIIKARLAAGVTRDVEIFSGPVTVRGKSYLYSVIHDVSDRIESQRALAESEHRFRELVENIAELFWVEDLDREEVLYLSPAYASIYGSAPAELQRQSRILLDAVIAEDGPTVEAARDLCRGGGDAAVTFRILRRDGEVRWLRARMFAVAGSSGGHGLVGIAEDLTDAIRSREMLAESEEKYRSIFNETADALYIHDGELNFLETNRVASERLGYARDEFRTMKVTDIHPPEGTAELSEQLKSLRDVGRNTYETVHVAKDGRHIPVEVNSRRIIYDGRAAVLSVARDITERKTMDRRLRKSLREKEVLLKEIHHRVKNNLQVINSLLRMQGRYVVDSRDEALFRMSEDRVKTMAIIHEELYESEDLASIRMKTYLTKLLRHLSGVYSASDRGIAIVDDIADVRLYIGEASPCALIVNELVTNSIKHAFLPGKGGNILVRLSTTADPAVLCLEVSDDGSGGVEVGENPESGGFGLTLVRGLATQLNADMTIDSKDGTRFRFEFRRLGPVPRAATESTPSLQP